MSQRFIVDGARKDTGDEQQIIVEADDVEQAEAIASIRGVFVSQVRPDPPRVPPRINGPLGQVPAPLSSSAPRSIAIIAAGVIVGVIGLAVLTAFVTGFLSVSGKPALSTTAQLSYADRVFFDALRTGNMADVKAALQGEPNLRATDPETGDTPLILVIRKIDSLIGIEHDRKELDAWAAFAGVLLNAGADVNGGPGAIWTPLHEARKSWTIKFLLDRGANVNGASRLGTPLYCKTADIWYYEAALLLSRGANPNLPNADGQTPLHKAAAENETKMIVLLLKSGAEVNKRDNKGYTPLKRARLSFQKEAAALLERNGGVE